MEIAGRPLSLIMRTAASPVHPAGLARGLRVYERPLQALRRYATAGGSYPWQAGVRTPLGPREIRCRSWHDMVTVHEVFARDDYAVGPAPATVLDGGANIGVVALWALTRRPDSRVRCFEPVEANIAELHSNLEGFEDRYEVDHTALAARSGEVSFGVEETGRYGGIGRDTGQTVTVRARAIGEAIDECLGRWERIDLLKLDVEGAELEILAALDAEHLARVSAIAVEHEGDLPADLPLSGFKAKRRLDIHRLVAERG